MTERKTITAYKGFDMNLQCRGFQYEIGGKYIHEGEVKPCESGFHACEHPLDVFGYYAPSQSRFCVVELDAGAIKDGDKSVSAFLSVKAELTLPEIIQRGVDFIMSKIDAKVEEGGDRSAATNTGYQSAATNTGNWSAATNTGYQSAATNTGYQSAATNTGDQSAATNTGNWSAATNTGNWSAATNTGYQSAATNTGYQSAATNTGNRSAATNTGYQSAASVEGEGSHALNTGRKGKAKASIGSAIYLAEYSDDGKLEHVFSGITGQNGLKPDTWYTLKGGNPVEADGDDA